MGMSEALYVNLSLKSHMTTKKMSGNLAGSGSKRVLQDFRIITDYHNVVHVHVYFDVSKADRDASIYGANLCRHFVDENGI